MPMTARIDRGGRRRDSGGRVLVGDGDRDGPSAARTVVRIPGIDPGANRRTRRPCSQAAPPVDPIRRRLAGVRPPELAECRQLYPCPQFYEERAPRDAACASLIPVETSRPLLRPLPGACFLFDLPPALALPESRALVVQLLAAG